MGFNSGFKGLINISICNLMKKINTVLLKYATLQNEKPSYYHTVFDKTLRSNILPSLTEGPYFLTWTGWQSV